nr:MAG TPA: hypothetical protein [Caudoviricetes sp.]
MYIVLKQSFQTFGTPPDFPFLVWRCFYAVANVGQTGSTPVHGFVM